ncbi:MAG: zinc protease [Pseudoalteromonas tetraodonis]|jgi:zinc protease
MKTVLCSLLLLVSLGLSQAQDAAKKAPAWGFETSDLKPDPEITFGTLGNGLRYVILPNAEPPERTSLRLYVDAGSLMETEKQRGLAHFIEHMAFNGTKNFPGGKMVEYFQRLGMSFGGDTNAHTSFKETVYKLELPKPDEKLLREGLQLFRDYADGMLLTQNEIEKERGVILSEKLTRDSPDSRTMEAAFDFALPDSIISKRLPIGTKEVIKGAGRDTFVDFYKKWYTCDRMVFVAVGAVEPETLVPLIEEYFSSMKKPAPGVPDPDLGKITRGRGAIAKIHYEKEASSTDIGIETVQPWKYVPDTAETRLADLRIGTANWIIGRRLQKLAKKEGAPFMRGASYEMGFLDFVRFGGMSMTCKPENWEGALQVADQELRRALEHGFTDTEITEANADTLNAYQEAAEGSETRLSRDLADGLVDQVAGQTVATSPTQDLEWIRGALGKVTSENCLGEFRKLWSNTEDVQIFVGGNLRLADGEDKIVEAFKKSRAVKVEAPEEVEQKAFAYTDFGEPGKVVETKVHEDLGVTQMKFANHVRLNLKPTDFEKGTILISMRIGSGELSAPKDKPGLSMVASSTFTAGGLVEHTSDELQQIFAGKSVGTSFGVDEDAFVLAGRTNSDDLLLQCQLFSAYLTAPGYREEGLRQFRKQLDTLYTQLAHSPQGVMANEVEKFLAGGDFRFGFPSQGELGKRDLDEVKAWLSEPLAKGYLEIGVVGDFEQDAVVEAIAKTFGALSVRADSKPRHEDARKLNFPAGGSKVFEFESEIPKGNALVYWPTEDIWDIKRSRRLGVLGSIFADRLRAKVREELGEAYSPYARNIPSQTYTGSGKLFSMVTVDPEQGQKIINVVAGIGKDLNLNGVDSDELERAILPLVSSVERQVRTNDYWLNSVTLSSQEFPQRLNWARSMLDDFKAVTVDEVNALAKEYLADDKAVKVIIKPKK